MLSYATTVRFLGRSHWRNFPSPLLVRPYLVKISALALGSSHWQKYEFNRYMDLTDNYSILFPPHLQLLVTIQHLKLSAKSLVTGHNSIWQMLHWIIWNHLHNSLSLSARLFPDVAEEYLHVVFRAVWAAKHVESGNVWNCSDCVVPYNFCQVCASSETPYPGQFPTLSQLNLWCKLDIVGQKICPIQCKWFINHW